MHTCHRLTLQVAQIPGAGQDAYTCPPTAPSSTASIGYGAWVKHRWMQPRQREKVEVEAEVTRILQAVGTQYQLTS